LQKKKQQGRKTLFYDVRRRIPRQGRKKSTLEYIDTFSGGILVS